MSDNHNLLILTALDNILNSLSTLHEKMNKPEKPDHLDGLREALKIISQIENHYKAMGFEGDHIRSQLNGYNPFYDIKNKIRMYLGLPFILD